ncbi:hypothetical protein LTR17_021739 [Elasticomyces elasticus]|nr:hypothetical protein LTR17_021739 [Elasticomyces elasticus]
MNKSRNKKFLPEVPGAIDEAAKHTYDRGDISSEVYKMFSEAGLTDMRGRASVDQQWNVFVPLPAAWDKPETDDVPLNEPVTDRSQRAGSPAGDITPPEVNEDQRAGQVTAADDEVDFLSSWPSFAQGCWPSTGAPIPPRKDHLVQLLFTAVQLEARSFA